MKYKFLDGCASGDSKEIPSRRARPDIFVPTKNLAIHPSLLSPEKAIISRTEMLLGVPSEIPFLRTQAQAQVERARA